MRRGELAVIEAALYTEPASGTLAAMQRQLVLMALAPNLNGVSMGQTAAGKIYAVLNLKCGDEAFTHALEMATHPQLDRMVELCDTMIDLVKRNPHWICACCGQAWGRPAPGAF